MRTRLFRCSKNLLLRRLVFTIVAIFALLALIFSLFFTNSSPRQDISSPPTKGYSIDRITITPGLPDRLIIPSININVSIDYLGLAADGTMDIRPNSKLAAWYMLGPRPGDVGSAVIAGHYGWDENGESAIFNDIHKLKKGDEISVIDRKGQSTTFVVREIRKYIPESDASAVFKSSDGNSHLNLITCDGFWKSDTQSYSNRLVVFADIKK